MNTGSASARLRSSAPFAGDRHPQTRQALPERDEPGAPGGDCLRSRRGALILLATGLVLLAGCTPPKKEEEDKTPVIARVSGVVMYLQRLALPPGAIVTVQIIDASSREMVKPVLGEQVLKDARQLPVRFQIDFDMKTINQESTYLVQAAVLHNERVVLVNRGLNPVITRGYPTEVEVMMDEPPN